MKKILSIILASFALVSCVDTVLLPDDKTVEEDFWQTKSDVQKMINGAYSAMATADVQSRLIVWTSRSDELLLNTALRNETNITELNQISSANITTTNSYNNWACLYAVINTCNLIIDKSASVMDIDPSYLEGDHLNTVAQMKALRSLCYFYLIRVFRDVPLILEPYKESSQDMNVPQVAPAVVLEQIIADLEEVKNNTLSSQSISDWQRCGYLTRDGVYALLADVYLWKASVYGDEASYDKCIECCNAVRSNRSTTSNKSFGYGSASDLDDDGYGLNSYTNWTSLFVTQNNNESLFELEYSANTSLCQMYNKYKKSNTSQSYFYASEAYSKISADDNHVFNHADYDKDVRGFNSVGSFNGSGDEGFRIRKMVSRTSIITANGAMTGSAVEDRAYDNYDQNWIIYRVADVILMKAEALVQKAAFRTAANADLVNQIAAATTAQDSLNLANQLQAVNLSIAAINVNAVHQAQMISMRTYTSELSNYAILDSTKYSVSSTPYSGTDLAAFVRTQVNTFNNFSTQTKELEQLVLNERARELCFEGKRWFDMLRYNYRHTTGVNYSTILGMQGGAYASNYDGMLTLMARKFTDGSGSAISAKMLTEPYLYMPILQSEVEVNSALIQNPVYTDGSTTSRNP